MKKYKAIAIPVTFEGDRPRFLTVRDRRFKDWIFVTGGCRRREIYNPLRCALRELEEETRGVVSLKRGEYTEFNFIHKESPTVELVYNVYVFFVNYKRTDQFNMIKKFNDEKMKTNIKKINKQDGIMVICNLHSLEIAKEYCDRLIGLSDGKIVFDGHPSSLTKELAEQLYDLENE